MILQIQYDDDDDDDDDCGGSMKSRAVVVILLTSIVVASESFLYPELDSKTTNVMNRVLQKSIRNYQRAMEKVSTLTLAVTICVKPRCGSAGLLLFFFVWYQRNT